MADSLIVKFTGDEAENHRVPAYEATQSLAGVSRSLVLVGNYLFEGKIRKRYPYSDRVQFYLTSTRPGSFETLFVAVISNPEIISIAKDVGIDVAKKVLLDGVRYVFNRAIGRQEKPATQELKEIEDRKSGDLDALTDAVEPALRMGHTVIGNGARQVVIINGSNNVVKFDNISKEYISSSLVLPQLEEMIVSVGSLNANTGYGRVFVDDLGKTVPFSVDVSAQRGTKGALSASLDRYTNGKPSHVSIKFSRVVAPDGRTKKFIIHAAKFLEPEII